MTPAPGTTVRVAAAQFFSGADVVANLELCVSYMRRAADVGARLLVMPENSNRVRDFADREDAYAKSEDLDGAFVQGIRDAARELGLHVVLGVDLRSESAPDVYIGQLLIGPDGELLHVHHKTVFWDYEYTLFTPGTKPLEVVETEIGRLGLLVCADGIVPEVPRVLGLSGAEIFCNSLNSRGPDEMRVHEPLRAIENHVWHVAANTVGGPEDGYPWTGGSQIVSPTGEVLACAGETEEGMAWADITPATSFPKALVGIGSLDDFRRPDLYDELVAPVDSHAVAASHGAVAPDAPAVPLAVATLQVSRHHSLPWTLTRTVGQISYAATAGATLGVFPELHAYGPGEVEADPAAAAALGRRVLDLVVDAAAEHGLWVVVNVVEEAQGRFYSTAYLVSDTGDVEAAYRKAHLSETERAWATAGTELVVAETPVGVIGLMIGNEVWLPEVMRILTLRGAELVAHPANWDRVEAATQAATERTEENRTHLVSTTRTDNPAGLGSQIVIADRFVPGQPVALMRYPTAVTSRTGFEENIFLTLDLQDSHSKVQGFHLDPIATRQPDLYGVFVEGAVLRSAS